MKRRKEGSGKFSLRLGLTGLVAGCWLIPIILIVAILSYYTTVRTRQQSDDTISRMVNSAAYNSRRELDSLISASRQASTDGTILQANNYYKINQNDMMLYQRITVYLSQRYRYNDDIISTLLFLTDDTETIYTMHNPTVAGVQQMFSYYQDELHNEVIKLAEDLDTRILFFCDNNEVYLIRNLMDKNYQAYGVIIMLLNKEKIFNGFLNISGGTGAIVQINGQQLIIKEPAEGGKLEDFEFPAYTQISRGTTALMESGKSSIMYGRESIDSAHILYAVEVDNNYFTRHLTDLRWIIIVLAMFLIPLVFFTVAFLYRNIIMPIHRLVDATKTIQSGNLGYVIDTKAENHEFAHLTEAINAMSQQLKEQFEHIYNEELALRDARIMALQSQINPHFLNNTLEIINWETRMGHNAKASRMIEALSIMLDAAMDRKSIPLVKLSQELMYVDAYLYIISERFGKRLKVSKEIDESLLQETVPRLIMQPIIENAIEHGLTPKQTALVVIRVKTEDGNMIIEVENDMPMSQNDKERVRELLSPDYNAAGEGSLHLGIRNVNMRLQMIYGERYVLKIESVGKTTVSSICIPII